MKKLALALLVFACLAAPVASQEQRPTRKAVAPTPTQLEQLKAGVRFHDQGKFDEAIAFYEAVLKESPDCILALYEIANSYQGKQDYKKVLEYATRGIEYDSPELPSFYMVMGSAYDDMGDSTKAIDAYKRGIAIAPSFLLYYNLGLTFERLNNDDEAKGYLKQGLVLNPNHASSHAELGKLFLRKGLTSQGVLALSRFLILEPASPRTGDIYRPWLDLLRRSVSSGTDGKMSITVNPKTDVASEGDFASQDLLIAISRASAMVQAEGKTKTEAQILVEQFDTWFAMLATDKVTDKSAFAWSYYAPYFLELQKRGYTEPFVYWVSQRTTLPGVREWVAVEANRQRATEFVQWSQRYVWPKG